MPDLDDVLLSAKLNGDCRAAALDCAALRAAMQAQGDAWHDLVTERCPYLFADVPVFVSAAHLGQMHEVIAAVERVVALQGWDAVRHDSARGVFYGYDFHINADGAHLIEINTNAGGGFLTALLLESQRANRCHGVIPAHEHPEQLFLEMFRNEWWLERATTELRSVAILDEKPEGQYLYPEFLLAQRMFARAGIEAHVVDPSQLVLHGDGLYFKSGSAHGRIDLVYNRLTDFSLQHHPELLGAYLDGDVVLTPAPSHYARYADKRNLVRLTDAQQLRALGADSEDIDTLQVGVPLTREVNGVEREKWWQERRHWFFKPATGYGSKGSYSGAKLTRRVFDEIMQGGYVAQRVAEPGERMVCSEHDGEQRMKYDLRCYVYGGQVQLIAARLYQGQVTNFRTPGGGFAPVYLVG